MPPTAENPTINRLLLGRVLKWHEAGKSHDQQARRHLATFRFYGQLNDFIPRCRRHRDWRFPFLGQHAVGDLVERLGPPHTEIALITINQARAEWSKKVQGGERIAIYPRLKWQEANPLLPIYTGKPRFVLDVHLGKLARFLRLLGFDGLFRPDLTDPEIAGISVTQDRIVLTRDIGLLKRRKILHGYYPRSTNPRAQLKEVIAQYDLAEFARPFSRCLNCNGVLQEASKASVTSAVPKAVWLRYSKFARCDRCLKVFWEGGHYQDMRQFIAQLF